VALCEADSYRKSGFSMAHAFDASLEDFNEYME
jgi:hypothetical protein